MIEQRTNDWYQARLGKATGSRFNDIMAGSKYAGWKNYRAELVAERLTGALGNNYSSPAMLWGTDNEPLARLHYTLRSRNQVEETGFWEHDTLAAGASPDGLILDTGLVEIKCPNTATHIETLRKRQVPRQYVAQVQGQMWITGRQWADFVSFDPRLPDNAKLIIIHIERDDEYITELEEQVTIFLEEVDAECEFVRNYGEPKVSYAK